MKNRQENWCSSAILLPNVGRMISGVSTEMHVALGRPGHFMAPGPHQALWRSLFGSHEVNRKLEIKCKPVYGSIGLALHNTASFSCDPSGKLIAHPWLKVIGACALGDWKCPLPAGNIAPLADASWPSWRQRGWLNLTWRHSSFFFLSKIPGPQPEAYFRPGHPPTPSQPSIRSPGKWQFPGWPPCQYATAGEALASVWWWCRNRWVFVLGRKSLRFHLSLISLSHNFTFPRFHSHLISLAFDFTLS